MSEETANIGLVLPDLSEAFDLEGHWNHNSTIIDAEIGVLKQTTAEHTQDIEGLEQTTTAQGQQIAGKQDALTFDSTPTSGSNNPVMSGGIYTDQQRQDTEISAKATVGDIFGIPGTSIAPAEGTTGTLAAYTAPGMYTVPTATAASRLTDTPITDKGFIMEVRQYRSGAYYRQTIYAWNESNAFYTRSRTGGANWTAWYKFEGTQVAVSSQSAPASLMQAGRLDAAELTDTQEVTNDA